MKNKNELLRDEVTFIKYQKTKKEKQHDQKMKNICKDFKKSSKTMKGDFEAFIKMFQLFSDDVIRKNEDLNELILSLQENVASGEELNTKLKIENATLFDSMQDLKQNITMSLMNCHF